MTIICSKNWENLNFVDLQIYCRGRMGGGFLLRIRCSCRWRWNRDKWVKKVYDTSKSSDFAVTVLSDFKYLAGGLFGDLFRIMCIYRICCCDICVTENAMSLNRRETRFKKHCAVIMPKCVRGYIGAVRECAVNQWFPTQCELLCGKVFIVFVKNEVFWQWSEIDILKCF